MVAVAFCAVMLALAVWTVRHFEAQVRAERLLAEHARYQALLARDLAAEARSVQAALVASKLGSTDQQKTGTVWAGLTADHPIFRAGQTKDLRIELSLVNDSDKIIDPKIAESHIVVNGKKLGDSEMILRSVPKEARFKAMSPGESLQFDCLLGDQFKEPGIYRVSWKGAGFQSSEILIRILPDSAH
jgi:hypothetical protein